MLPPLRKRLPRSFCLHTWAYTYRLLAVHQCSSSAHCTVLVLTNFNIVWNLHTIRKNSSNHGRLISKKSVLFLFWQVFSHPIQIPNCISKIKKKTTIVECEESVSNIPPVGTVEFSRESHTKTRFTDSLPMFSPKMSVCSLKKISSYLKIKWENI